MKLENESDIDRSDSIKSNINNANNEINQEDREENKIFGDSDVRYEETIRQKIIKIEDILNDLNEKNE